MHWLCRRDGNETGNAVKVATRRVYWEAQMARDTEKRPKRQADATAIPKGATTMMEVKDEMSAASFAETLLLVVYSNKIGRVVVSRA